MWIRWHVGLGSRRRHAGARDGSGFGSVDGGWRVGPPTALPMPRGLVAVWGASLTRRRAWNVAVGCGRRRTAAASTATDHRRGRFVLASRCGLQRPANVMDGWLSAGSMPPSLLHVSMPFHGLVWWSVTTSLVIDLPTDLIWRGMVAGAGTSGSWLPWGRSAVAR